MLRTIKCCFFCLTFCLFHMGLFAQKNNIVSLITRLKTAKEDTNKVNRLNDLGWELMNSNTDTAIILGKQGLSLAEKLHWKKGVANSYGNLGVYNYFKADYINSLDYFHKALNIHEAINNKEGVAKCLGNIGSVYRDKGDYPKTLDYLFRALKMAEEIKNKNLIAAFFGNIGNIYNILDDYPRALGYYFKALKMAEELRDKNRMAIWLGNIGIVYNSQANYPKALYFYFKALKIAEELSDKNGIAADLSSIGNVYAAQSKTEKSKAKREELMKMELDYYFRALKINQELGDKNSIVINLGNIGSLFTEMKNFKEGEKYLLDALKINKEIGALNEERQIEEALTGLYVKTGRHQLALEYYKNAMVLKDSLFNEEKNKEITRKEMNFEFEKKEAFVKAEQDKKDAVSASDSKRQRAVLLLVSFVLLLVAIVAFIIFRSLRITRQQKSLIEKQKQLVEEHQKEILDSIHYAKRIQTSLLPTNKYINKTLIRLIKN